MKKLVAVLVALVALIFLLACGDAEDAQTSPTPDHNATAQAILSATPTPTPTLVHQITDIVTHHKPDDGISKLHGIITGAIQNGSVYRVDVTQEKSYLGAAYARGEIQRDTYAVLDALYASDRHPDQVTVRIFAPVTDKYGNTSNQQIAVAVLTKQTEALFNWTGLDYRSAWAVYDQAEYLEDGL